MIEGRIITHFVFPFPSETKSEGLQCVEYTPSGVRNSADQSDDNYEYENADETAATKSSAPGAGTCTSETNSCFSVWRTDENGTKVIEAQGCWPTLGKELLCGKRQCIGRKHQTSSRAHLFCCCKSHRCNANMTEDTTSATFEGLPLPSDVPNAANVSLISAIQKKKLLIIVFIIIAPLILSIIYVAACRKGTKSDEETTIFSAPNPKYSANLLNVDNLKLCSMIGQGKYSTVWKGMINEQSVAVKIFPAQHKDYFLNERDIYTLPLMETPHFLEYFGCDERRTLNDNIEYLLVMSLAPLGNLHEWLTENTSTFSVFVNMARSLSKGLSYLHSDQTSGVMTKPCICHRDLNSRNVLVKADLTCCISDFGFALKMYGSRYEWKGEMAMAEHRSINEVGTVRYLAPEVRLRKLCQVDHFWLTILNF